jgi:hypothetical protein
MPIAARIINIRSSHSKEFGFIRISTNDGYKTIIPIKKTNIV